MFVVIAVLRPLFRRRLRSLIVVVVSLVLVLFLNMYEHTILQHHETLNELYANIEVTGYIADSRGNLDGLKVAYKIIRELESSGFVRQGSYTLRLPGIIGTWEEVDIARVTDTLNSPMLVGRNDIVALPQQLEFMDGYDEEMFAGEEMVCVVSHDFLAEHGLYIGAELMFTAIDIKKYPIEAQTDIGHATVPLKIVGVYQSFISPAPIYCPLAIATRACRNMGTSLYISSASFTLQNTRELNQLRNMLLKMGFVSPRTGSGSDNLGLSFTINDRLLKKAISSIENYIDFTKALYPIIYLLCAGIGFITSYLLIRIRKPEFAIMRSLGTSRVNSFFIFFVEQGLLCLLGTALGTAIMAAAVDQFSLGTGLGYICLYLVGSGMAITMMNRTNVVEILTARE